MAKWPNGLNARPVYVRKAREAPQSSRAVTAEVTVRCSLYRSQWVKHRAMIVTRESIEKELEMGRQKSSDPPSTTKYKHHIREQSKMYDRVNLRKRISKDIHVNRYLILVIRGISDK